MPDDIVLIGPVRAGKSTLGKLLAGKLGLPQVSLDNLRYDYYKEIGFDENHARDIRKNGGFLAMMYYRELFAAHAVERMLSDHEHCVFDFGAGIYESDEMFARVHKALACYPNVVLLLPSPNTEETLRILIERDPNSPADLTFDINAHFLQHHTYYDLAKFTIYTQGKSPEESCHEILARLRFAITVH
jgi:adenylate kinase family enzyme